LFWTQTSSFRPFYLEVSLEGSWIFSSNLCLHIIEELDGDCDIISPKASVDAIRSDPDDNRILECAAEAHAHFIVSGDPHLFNLGEFEKMRSLSPTDYLNEFEAR